MGMGIGEARIIHLLNTAVMPQPGKYVMESLDITDFSFYVQMAHESGKLVSYVGYPETAKMIEEMTGVPISVSREKTRLEDGDIMIIARLKFRISPGAKADAAFQKNEGSFAENFEFFRCVYAA